MTQFEMTHRPIHRGQSDLVDKSIDRTRRWYIRRTHVCPRPFDHGGRHVNADSSTLRADHLRSEEYVQAPPEPRSTMTSPGRMWAVAVGFPQESPMLASAGIEVSSSAV